MRLGCGVTAARQQASRLAGLAGLCPAPRTARDARRGVGGHAAWLRSYRRSATGLAARRAGVVSRQLADIGRHSATGLMACFHSPACLKNRLGFFVGENSVLQWKKLSFSCLPQSQPCCSTISHLALVEHGSHKLRKTAKSGSLRCAIVQATTQPPTHISLSIPIANCGGAERR